MKGYFEFMVLTGKGGSTMRYTVPVENSSQHPHAMDVVKSVFPDGRITSAKFVDTDRLELNKKQEDERRQQQSLAQEKKRQEWENLQSHHRQVKLEKDRIRSEQNRIESERIAAEKRAEKARIKAQKEKERKIEALSKALPEDEKQEYDLQLQALNEAKEKFKTEKENIEFKMAIVPILFISIFVFLYTLIDIMGQYHGGKLTSFSDIYTGANNIIFLISLPLAIWASISFQNHIFKASEDKTLTERIVSFIALLSLIGTYVTFRNTFDITYFLPLGIVSLVMFYISFKLFKKRLNASIIPVEDELIIQENKYQKLIRRLQLY